MREYCTSHVGLGVVVYLIHSVGREQGVWPIDMHEYCTSHAGLLACLGVVVYLIHSVGTGTYIIGIQRRQGAGCVAY